MRLLTSKGVCPSSLNETDQDSSDTMANGHYQIVYTRDCYLIKNGRMFLESEHICQHLVSIIIV